MTTKHWAVGLSAITMGWLVGACGGTEDLGDPSTWPTANEDFRGTLSNESCRWYRITDIKLAAGKGEKCPGSFFGSIQGDRNYWCVTYTKRRFCKTDSGWCKGGWGTLDQLDQTVTGSFYAAVAGSYLLVPDTAVATALAQTIPMRPATLANVGGCGGFGPISDGHEQSSQRIGSSCSAYGKQGTCKRKGSCSGTSNSSTKSTSLSLNDSVFGCEQIVDPDVQCCVVGNGSLLPSLLESTKPTLGQSCSLGGQRGTCKYQGQCNGKTWFKKSVCGDDSGCCVIPK